MALPPCGIYKTTLALPGREEEVPAQRLVYFHNHSEQGPPMVLLPKSNSHNRWTFHDRGYLIEGDAAPLFITTMVSLPEEGLYVVQRTIQTGDGGIPARTLVQVGYNPSGHAILFPAQARDNGLTFPDRGTRFEALKVFDKLARAPFEAPLVEGESDDEEHPEPRILH